MKKTDQLINSLAQEATPIKSIPNPNRLTIALVTILVFYGLIIWLFTGFRQDLSVQFHRPFFLAEITLLLITTLFSIIASAHLTFPDQYQKMGVFRLPFFSFIALSILILLQIFLPIDQKMVIPSPKQSHNIECTQFIALAAVIPSAIIFILLRKGASTHLYIAGAYAILASSSIGCLMLRLSEQNDSLLHLVSWHYIPTLLLATVGAYFCQIFLKW